MLAIKSNAACLDSCHWLNPTAIKSNVPFKLLRSIRPEIFNSDFIVRAFSIAVGFNQRPTAAIKLNVACLDSGLSKKYGWS